MGDSKASKNMAENKVVIAIITDTTASNATGDELSSDHDRGLVYSIVG
jgi:hypothetical protein